MQKILHIVSSTNKYNFHCLRNLFSTVPSSNSLALSEKCVKRLKSVGESQGHLRVLVEGGGCSGFQYKFELDKDIKSDDNVIERDGVKLIIDPDSLELLKGSTIDYQEELIRSGFKVVSNPQAEKGCSCGVSFAVRMD